MGRKLRKKNESSKYFKKYMHIHIFKMEVSFKNQIFFYETVIEKRNFTYKW